VEGTHWQVHYGYCHRYRRIRSRPVM
jgi:hypothetical protein